MVHDIDICCFLLGIAQGYIQWETKYVLYLGWTDVKPEKYIPLICNLGLLGVAWGSIGHVIIFRKRLAALAGCWLESRHAQLVSLQFQSDQGPVKPAGSQSWGTQVIYDS